MTAGEKMMMNLAAKALADNDLKAIQLVLEHMEGKPTQSVTAETWNINTNAELDGEALKGAPDEMVAELYAVMKRHGR